VCHLFRVEPFASLTDGGRLRRLRRLAERALESYDLNVVGITPVAHSFNTIYRIRISARPAHLIRIGPSFQFHPPDTDTMAAAWQHALRADVGLPVPQYVPTRTGAITSSVSLDGVPEPRTCAVLSWVPGRPMEREASMDQANAAGRLLAQLHEHATNWTPPEGLRVPIANRVAYLDDEPLLETLAQHRNLYLEAQDRAQQTIDAIWDQEPAAPHVVHGDLTGNNTIVARAGLVPIDFQDLAIAHEVQDISISLLPLTRLDPGGNLSRAFRAGYEDRRTWPSYGPDVFEALFAARRIQMANVSLHLRRPDMDAYLDRSAEILASWMKG
jgi:Ser/Thr protein kinase RdoA (MazF antagonist)